MQFFLNFVALQHCKLQTHINVTSTNVHKFNEIRINIVLNNQENYYKNLPINWARKNQ